MHGRWVVADPTIPTDMCKSSDFLHVLDMADKLAIRLNKFSTDLASRPGSEVPSSLRQDATQLLVHFTTIRSQFVDTLVSKALRVQGLQPLLKEIRVVGRTRIYAHDNATLAGFLTAIWEQLTTQSVT